MSRAAPMAALLLIRQFEGRRLSAYPDPASALAQACLRAKIAIEAYQTLPGWRHLAGGTWTVGYGHTGPDVTAGLTITVEGCWQRLGVDAQRAADRVCLRVDDAAVIAAMSDERFAALVDFAFNEGADPTWRIWSVLKARQWDAVPAQLERFIYAGGHPMKGLQARRAAEVALWNAPPVTPPSAVAKSA